jgi:hypothetical protein
MSLAMSPAITAPCEADEHVAGQRAAFFMSVIALTAAGAVGGCRCGTSAVGPGLWNCAV